MIRNEVLRIFQNSCLATIWYIWNPSFKKVVEVFKLANQSPLDSLTSASMLKNSHRFSHGELSSYTRRIAFEGVVPKTKGVTANCTIVSSQDKSLTPSTTSVAFVDPLKERTIPSYSDLEKWETYLKHLPAESYIQYFEGGRSVNFNKQSIESTKKLHKILDCKHNVERELEFFSSPKMYQDLYENP